jgi:hypothetical protein
MKMDETHARGARVRLLALSGGTAVLAVAGVLLGAHSWTSGAGSSVFLAVHSQDGATGTTYVQPTIPAASVNPTAMSIGSTITNSPQTELATSVATVAASLTTPAAGCISSICPGINYADP